MNILMVEDDVNTQEIVKDILEDSVYHVEVCDRGDEAENVIKREEWDLILLDIMLPGKDGFELLKLVKKRYKFTPVIVFTVSKERREKIKAYEMGVDDFINKPFDRWEFLARVRSLLNLRQSYQQLEETQNIVVSLAHAIEAKDPYTRGHSDRVGKYSKEIALALGFSESKAEDLYWAGVLHDIGKIAVPLEILTKPSELSEQEYDKIKSHPIVSYNICKGLRTLKRVLSAIKHHHERWDGNGYPDGLKEKEIPAEARIMAVADAYDALTSDRAYRKAVTSSEALEILKNGKGTQWQDSIVDTFIEIFSKNEQNYKCT
ncbi:MAG: HD domain-containing phosphohydrolase [Elusimicrobiota bacterium]